jgi:hypothetical protein
MTSSAAKDDYNLVFQGHADGLATVVSSHVLSEKPMPNLHFPRGGKINIRVLGPDGTPSSMESVQVDFKVENAPTLSPLGDGTKANFLWQAGERYTHIVDTDGIWKFGAVLTARNGTQYTLPDPEFQVGDGGMHGRGKADSV